MTNCIVCRRGEGPVCDDDRSRIATMLEDLPGHYAQLTKNVMAGSSSPQMAALSLLAGGSESVTGMLHPLVRRWTTRRRVIVARIRVIGGVASVFRREEEITEYHREAVVEHDPASGRRCRCGRVHDTGWRPLQVPDDDQIGTLPPREWLDTQVRYWRLKLGHHVPPRTLYRPTKATATAAARQAGTLDVPALLQTDAGRHAWSYLHTLAWHRQRGINARLGLVDDQHPELRTDDPLYDELEARFGEPPRSLALTWDVKYLLTHLDTACERGEELGLDTFAAELAALTAEIGRVLRTSTRGVWIGRCPAVLVDPDDPEQRKRTCGAGLWQQPEWAQATCPRCHTAWDTRGPAGRTLARQIRNRWPVDRRRRYNADEMARLSVPRCPGCRERVTIDWREVTGVREKPRWWQARAARCRNGCADAGRVL